MRKPRKIENPERTFFTSDTHFNHAHPVLMEARAADDMEHMNELTVKQWNSTVPNDGIVYALGDFFMRTIKPERTREILNALNFSRLHLLWGNHTAGVAKLYRDELLRRFGKKSCEFDVYPLNASVGSRVVTFLGQYHELLWEKQLIVLSHFAMRNWRHNEKGSWMLCGHSHGYDAAIKADSCEGKILDVGIDSVGPPISLMEIQKIMDKRTIVAPDAHR